MSDRNDIDREQEIHIPVASGAGSVRPVARRSSHDDLFGKVVLFVIGLLLVSGTAFFVLVGIRVSSDRNDGRESIGSLTAVPVTHETVSETPETTVLTAPTQATPSIDKASVAAKVLNGGAVKGSAVKVADILKKAGFTKTDSGNANGDYAGVTVYFKADSEKAANAVRDVLLQTYTNAKVSPQDAKKPETGASPVTVILGK